MWGIKIVSPSSDLTWKIVYPNSTLFKTALEPCLQSALPSSLILFKTHQPCLPVLWHHLWAQLVSVGRRAVLVGHNNEPIFNLQPEHINNGTTEHCRKSQAYSVDHLIFVVIVAVQSPSICCHLNGVVVCVAQERFGLFGRFPVNNAQHAPADTSDLCVLLRQREKKSQVHKSFTCSEQHSPQFPGSSGSHVGQCFQ